MLLLSLMIIIQVLFVFRNTNEDAVPGGYGAWTANSWSEESPDSVQLWILDPLHTPVRQALLEGQGAGHLIKPGAG